MNLVKQGKNNILDIEKNEFYALLALRDILMVDENSEKYRYLSYEYRTFTIDEIIAEVVEHSDGYSEEIRKVLLDKTRLQECLSLLVMLGEVLIDDKIDGNDTYRIVPIILIDSSYTRGYYNIDLNSAERLLLISDTHIGNEEYEDFDLIDKVFEYAKSTYGIDTVLHLGDVFHGIRLDKGQYAGYTMESVEVQEILDKQLKKFRDRFPKYMKVIAIEGNHDKSISDYLRKASFLGHNLNHLYLSILNPNFHLLSEREQGHIIDAQDMKISLSHPLRFNIFFPYVKTDEVEKEDKGTSIFKSFNTDNIDLLLSGHFHYSLNCSIPDDNNSSRRVIEVIPSLSKFYLETEDRCVAKIVRFIRNEFGVITHYGIMTLHYIDNKIVEGEEIIYPTNNELLNNEVNAYVKKTKLKSIRRNGTIW